LVLEVDMCTLIVLERDYMIAFDRIKRHECQEVTDTRKRVDTFFYYLCHAKAHEIYDHLFGFGDMNYSDVWSKDVNRCQ
jgi:hypothetical protein